MPTTPGLPSRARHAALAASLAACLACAPAPADRPSAAADAGPAVLCEDLTPSLPPGAPRHLRAARPLMGTAFEIRVVTSDAARGCEAINAAFHEVALQEARFSEYRPASAVSAINRAAGLSRVEVEPEVFTLLQRAVWASTATGGAFDVTFAACGRLWSIRERRVPDERALAECLPLVDYRRLQLDPWHSSVWLPEPGMRIGLGGIAKGYGVDRAAEVLAERGLSRFAVDGGGDLRVEGTDIDGAWTVRIAHPRQPDQVYAELRLDRGAIVTSGDYLRFFEQDGVRYHHVLDPATGYPARRSAAVTVIAQNATDADALATGLFVLGPARGLEAVARLPGVEALFFDRDLRVSASSGFPRARATRVEPQP